MLSCDIAVVQSFANTSVHVYRKELIISPVKKRCHQWGGGEKKVTLNVALVIMVKSVFIITDKARGLRGEEGRRCRCHERQRTKP
jgi:hypothetical protein